MGLTLPNINVTFTEIGVSAIKRSGRGIVALILKDDTPTFETKEYTRLDKVDREDFTEDNYDLIRNVFMGTPSKVVVEVMKTTADDVSDVLSRLNTKRVNYLAMPDAETSEVTEIATFVKSANKNDHKTFKAVLANNEGDDEGIANFTTEDMKVGNKVYTTKEFTARMAGILAGISLDRSATYYVIPEVESIKAIEDADTAIGNGELILIDDGEKVKIGRAVNSLVTTTTTKGDSFKKIKIVEGVHLMKDDIRTTFEDNYVGKYINNYDNKVLFITGINAYFKQLEIAYILDRSHDNKAEIDVNAQRLYIEGKGISTDEMSEQDIKEYNTGSNVCVKANVKYVDAMEDLDFNVFM